ncbi:protein bfr2-like [Schistocerca piceifrons]|uniref:protein bfr2-like n=1 Tax=Schistocerca piceifrons TaxID=274613 RepID=UPI001F5EF8E9|nr:protein bfr2-like [Schistocerca piceifrons]
MYRARQNITVGISARARPAPPPSDAAAQMRALNCRISSKVFGGDADDEEEYEDGNGGAGDEEDEGGVVDEGGDGYVDEESEVGDSDGDEWDEDGDEEHEAGDSYTDEEHEDGFGDCDEEDDDDNEEMRRMKSRLRTRRVLCERQLAVFARPLSPPPRQLRARHALVRTQTRSRATQRRDVRLFTLPPTS